MRRSIHYAAGRLRSPCPSPAHRETEADCARDEKPDTASDHLDFQYSHGVCKHFQLSFSKPIACSVHAAQPPSPDDGLQAAQKGLAILTMCWSYILSARLLELQVRKVVYTCWPHLQAGRCFQAHHFFYAAAVLLRCDNSSYGSSVLYALHLHNTQHFLIPKATSTFQDTGSDTIWELFASTSPALVRWLAVLLFPTPGWSEGFEDLEERIDKLFL